MYIYPQELYTSFHSDLTLLKQNLTTVKEADVDTNLNAQALEDLFEKTNSNTVAKIWEKVQTSYQQSIMELEQVLMFKINFFRTLMT